MKIAKLLESMLKQDNYACDKFREHFAWHPPRIEDHLELAKARLDILGGTVEVLLQILAREEKAIVPVRYVRTFKKLSFKRRKQRG